MELYKTKIITKIKQKQIPDCDYHSPALLDFFLSSDAIICSTMTLPPLGTSDHVVSKFPLTFHQIHSGMPHFIE